MAKKIIKPQTDNEWGNIELPNLSDDILLSKNWVASDANKVAWERDRKRLLKIQKIKNFKMRGVPKHGGSRSAEDIAKMKAGMNKPEVLKLKSIKQKAVWKRFSKKIKEKISKASQTAESKAKRKSTSIKNGHHYEPKLLKEIYDQVWGADRGIKLYKKLSKKYGISSGVIKNISHGRSIDPKQYKKDLKQWNSVYGILYKMIDPKGKELQFTNINDARVYAKQEVWGHFNCSKPKQKGKFKGWTFIKGQRKDS